MIVVRFNYLTIDYHTFHIRARGYLVHHIEEDFFDDGTQSASSSFLLQRAFRRLSKRIPCKDQLYTIQLQRFLVLLDNSVLGLGQNANQRIFIQAIQRDSDRKSSNKFGDEAIFE